MHQKLKIELGLTKKNKNHLVKINMIEAYYRIREAMNRFAYGKILDVDYDGSYVVGRLNPDVYPWYGVPMANIGRKKG